MSKKIGKGVHVQARLAQVLDTDRQCTTFHNHPKVLKAKQKNKLLLIVKFGVSLNANITTDVKV